MCGRIYVPSEAEIERYWHLGRSDGSPFPRRYNVAPGQGNADLHVPVIRAGESGPELARMQWWLLPWFSKEPRCQYSTFNARIETVARASAFRDPFVRRRCLVPVLGYYEWQHGGRTKIPWLIQPADRQLMHFAGLWDRWRKDDRVIESFSIIVGPAGTAVESIHDRQPVILPPERFGTWLDRELTATARVMELLQGTGTVLECHRVSARVNDAKNDDATLIEPAENQALF